MDSLTCSLLTLRLVSKSLKGPKVLRWRSEKPPSFEILAKNHSFRSSDSDSCSLRVESSSQAELRENCKQWQLSNTIQEVSNANKRIEVLIGEIKQMFQLLSDGETSASAYDTAWVAMVPSIDDGRKPQFPVTLEWIITNQNEDGSWGEPSFFLLYDRLVCTLACVIALKTWATGDDHITRGIQFLMTHITQLGKESNSLRTVGFEIIFPSMLSEARNLGIDLPYDIPYLKVIFELREKKIGRIPLDVLHSVPTTLLHSLEALQEVVEWEKVLKLQSRDGSLLSSPAATAVVYMKTGDKKCLEFLNYTVRRFGDHVDTIERLGIDHLFREEISRTLDYVYRHVGERGLSWGRDNPVPDIDDTCMALRLLRLHGYPVTSDILASFKDRDGKFVCFPGQSHKGVSDMFNLYRCSQVSFLGEKILNEAKDFVEPYLQNCIETNQVDDKWTLKKALNKEIDRALRYPWKTSLQRLEAREYMDFYGEDDLWIGKTVYWMSNINNPKYLELAKLDYNRLQNIHRRENDYIMKWWTDCGFTDPLFNGIYPQEIHFSIAATMYEPELSACRIAYTKCICIENVIKHIFESHESISNLAIVCGAVEQWNPALVNSLPRELKIAFMAMYDTLNQLLVVASKAQSKDIFAYLHGIRVAQIQEYMKNREALIENNSVSSLAEYLELGKKDVGVGIRLLPAMCLMGNDLEEYVLQFPDHRSKIYDELSLFLCLVQDVYIHKNVVGKETSNAISCCMKELICTEEEAVDHLKTVIDDVFTKLVHEYLKPSKVPGCCRRLMFEHARITLFLLNVEIDNKRTRNEMVRNAMERLFAPV